MAEQENQKNKGKEGRKIKDVNQRKSIKISGNEYLPVCVYVRKDLLTEIDSKKNLGWSRREIIEQGIIRMLQAIEETRRETIARVQAEEKNIKERIL